ncbi:MAG TPA: EF-hand domain-containing protein [Methylocella sp.]|nr:EF-hand domain-containing protein [Methylocella sp.]
MVSRRSFIGELCLYSLSAVILSTGLSTAKSSPIAALDKDNDGTLDLAEVKDAASALFDKLEKDKDGTLDAKEVGRRIGEKEFKEADPDNDGTLSKTEYLALVEKLFHAADADKDGTLDAKELGSKPGIALLHLIS